MRKDEEEQICLLTRRRRTVKGSVAGADAQTRAGVCPSFHFPPRSSLPLSNIIPLAEIRSNARRIAQCGMGWIMVLSLIAELRGAGELNNRPISHT